ncbi:MULTISPECIES: DUF305 domain-containing protein [unclassified Saccharothrix]|uniref:DUF305 domain-containing protein n=1 Tax=unclassified Saccharothrix TaxID=2593673 RepID=UPI00307F3B74
MTRKNLVGAALAVLTTGLVLAGCGSETGSGHDMSTMQSTTSAAATQSGDRNDADVTFARGMIPHHIGALDMAKLVEGRTSNPKVLDLAARIEKAQDPEIKIMTGWLKNWGAEVPATTGMPGMDHGDAGHGTDSAELEKLKHAKDAEFDTLFLVMMIKHHQGAIDMSNTELQQGRNAEAKELAQRIVDGQQAEIDEMKSLLPAG